jgi:chromosome segregation protein
MLKRLELVGFKSFADKTVFEFPPGLTAIVGPNGSGKSNVVDAVKWVLGEQSAKSLRGGEMADVIFSGSSNRRSLGLAEVTLTFDNATGALHTPAPEVQIARRVYRDGEGEYLINGQPSRLKDIKDLFLGTGAGADAYGIIEQGRVDALLQASTAERRTIFEEAAGISRFKAKKIESLRRLERVDANLQRLNDILGEVDNQLRSVRLQAAKAERYQEYSKRLREVRLFVGLKEYRDLTARAAEINTRARALQDQLDAAAARSAEWSDEARQWEASLGKLDAALRGEDGALAQAQIARTTHVTDLTHERAHSAELSAEIARATDQFQTEHARIAETKEAQAIAHREWSSVAEQCGRHREEVARLSELVAALRREQSELQKQIDTDQDAHLEHLRLAARMQNEAVSAHAHWEQLRRERDRLTHKSAQASESLASLDLELETLSQADADLQVRLATARQALADHTAALDDNRNQIEDWRRRLSDWRARHSGLVNRIEVLEALEQNHEGLGAGLRELLTSLDEHKDNGDSLRDCVVGLVGNWLSAPRDIAHLLDIALGALAECVIVRDADRLVLALQERTEPFGGRIRFLPIQSAAPRSFDCTIGCPPDVVRADRLVDCDHPELGGLAAQLLGTTWIVPNLAAARDLARRLPGHRFVTSAGELVEADGTITVGTHRPESGLLSRKSELRELRAQLGEAIDAVAAAENAIAALVEQTDPLVRNQRHAQQEIEVLKEQSSDLRERIGQRRERRLGLHEEVTLSRSELTGLNADLERLSHAWSAARERSEEAERAAQALQARIAQAETDLRAGEQNCVVQAQCEMAAQVALAQIEERRAAADRQRERLATELAERTAVHERIAARLADLESRFAACSLNQLTASQQYAAACLAVETAEARLLALRTERAAAGEQLRALHDRMQIAHGEWQARKEEVHAAQLAAGELQVRTQGLVDRLRDEHQIDLIEESKNAVAPESPSPELPAEGSAEEEIEELRRKLSRLGAVNLDSLQELAELELRQGALRVQFDDLTAAQKSLMDIITTINEDSRRLFAETFSLVRANFQDLFRRLFGGGQADVILENEADVLESGVEVVARPPGKELRSISLMSGGEKTMTAVALLLAIFRSKPSPFCLLDEVDAALDEANTARLAAVLREFLSRSQFIIVTHSKRTMAAADVLYGVTMEESGVSKRIAVRFEDWPDDQRQAA